MTADFLKRNKGGDLLRPRGGGKPKEPTSAETKNRSCPSKNKGADIKKPPNGGVGNALLFLFFNIYDPTFYF